MKDSIYGERLGELNSVMERLLGDIEDIRQDMKNGLGMDPVEHVLGRIKDEDSMREKCRRPGIPETPESALEVIHDAVGIRVVCAFLDDVYAIRDRLRELPGVSIVTEKDYIRNVKPNGYRSLHLILKVEGESGGRSCFAEVQLRTISMDTWAALEHHLKYKHDIGKKTALIVGELKRCADELAATDASMQTIRDAVNSL